jgi:hypothetical protein
MKLYCYKCVNCSSLVYYGYYEVEKFYTEFGYMYVVSTATAVIPYGCINMPLNNFLYHKKLTNIQLYKLYKLYRSIK